jgi:hypothetical protein
MLRGAGWIVTAQAAVLVDCRGRMRARLVLPLLCLLTGTTTIATAPPGPAIGLVRGDGTLQPLARLEGEAWTDVAVAEMPGAWQLWLFDDPARETSPFAPRAARALSAGAESRGPGCVAVAVEPAWISPIRAGAREPIGIALAGSDIRPDLPVEVLVDGETGRHLGTKAAAAFHRAEDEALTLQQEELPADFPTFAARRTRPIAWTRIVRQGVAQAATRTYYLEGAKDYEGFRGRTDIGRIRTTGHVFVRVAGPRETIDAEVDLSDVDGRQSVFRTPLAMLTWLDRAAWLFVVRGADGTRLELMDVTPGPNRPRSVWQGPDGCTRGDA